MDARSPSPKPCCNAAEELAAMRAEHEQFKQSSLELEQALEEELDEANSQLQRLERELQRKERVVEGLHSNAHQHGTEVIELQAKILAANNQRVASLDRIRELEQQKDDLSRQMRIVAHERDDLRERLEDALEDNVLLQQDVDLLDGRFRESSRRLIDFERDVERQHTALHHARMGDQRRHYRPEAWFECCGIGLFRKKPRSNRRDSLAVIGLKMETAGGVTARHARTRTMSVPLLAQGMGGSEEVQLPGSGPDAQSMRD